jgi:hypothetical protein
VHAAPPQFLQILDATSRSAPPVHALRTGTALATSRIFHRGDFTHGTQEHRLEDLPKPDEEILKGHDVASLGPGDSSTPAPT